VDPRTGLDDIERRKILPPSDSISDPSAVHPVASRYTDCAIPAPIGTGIRMVRKIRKKVFTVTTTIM
jgi:hypothetical protein